MKYKFEVTSKVSEFKAMAEIRTERKIKILRKDSGGEYLDHEEYTDELIKKFDMQDCETLSTPYDIHQKFEHVEEISGKYYQNLIGSLMYFAVLTHPDISNAVSKLSQYKNTYVEDHWKAVKRAIQYQKRTKNYCLVYKKNSMELTEFTDADWAGEARSS
ncbi:hypothetical protein PR048_016351 [Dryococelus australis]|uniref:Uncharacterized protein n=1 Tax=Dryococelus australis TaxID=614101 RepID=A0ABQ9HJH1_9NEOP|nr:hypothetical protein PR048_016351 [Dryococelus australis]